MRLSHSAAATMILIAAPAQASDAVLQRLLAESAKAPVVAFERTTREARRANEAGEPRLVIDRFTPKSATTGVWTLVSIDGRAPTAQEVAEHAKANSAPPGFHRLHQYLSVTPARRTESGNSVTYTWHGLPAGSIMTPGGDISARMSAEIVVHADGGKPVISKMRLFAAEPFSVKVVARINQFDVTSFYQAGPNGFPFLTSQVLATDVSAPFGMGGKRHASMTFRAL